MSTFSKLVFTTSGLLKFSEEKYNLSSLIGLRCYCNLLLANVKSILSK